MKVRELEALAGCEVREATRGRLIACGYISRGSAARVASALDMAEWSIREECPHSGVGIVIRPLFVQA